MHTLSKQNHKQELGRSIRGPWHPCEFQQLQYAAIAQERHMVGHTSDTASSAWLVNVRQRTGPSSARAAQCERPGRQEDGARQRWDWGSLRLLGETVPGRCPPALSACVHRGRAWWVHLGRAWWVPEEAPPQWSKVNKAHPGHCYHICFVRWPLLKCWPDQNAHWRNWVQGGWLAPRLGSPPQSLPSPSFASAWLR